MAFCRYRQSIFMKHKTRFIKLFYIILFLSVNTAVAANVKLDMRRISGRITDKATGLPIGGATVAIPDLKTATSTDANGVYLLKQLPRGEYLVQVTAIGYASVTKVIDLGHTYSVDFKLSASSYELADVIVTALGNTTTKQRTDIL